MAGQEIGSLFVALGLDSSVFTSGAKMVTAQTSKMERGLKTFGTRATALGQKLSVVSAALAGLGAATYALVNDVAASGDEIAKMARGAGVSGDYFQEMAYAMGQVADVSKGDLASSMTRVTKLLGEAQAGSKGAVATLERLGLSQADLAAGTITTEQAFDAYIKTVSGMDSATEAAALSAALLGKSGTDLGGKLMGSAGEMAALRDRATELGIVMSTRALDASENYGDAMADVAKGFEGLKIAIADKLLPVFVETLLPAINEKVIPALQGIVTKIANIIDWFVNLPVPVQEAVGLVAAALGTGGPILLAIGVMSTALSTLLATAGPIGLFIAAAAVIMLNWEPISTFFVDLWETVKSGLGNAIDAITAKWDAFVAKIEAAIQIAKDAAKAVSEALAVGREEMNSGTGYGGMAGAMDDPAAMFGGGDQSTGSNVAEGLIQGVEAGLAGGKGRIESAIQSDVIDAVEDRLKIKSPSRVFIEIGKFVSEGLGLGIQAGLPQVQAAMATVGAEVNGDGLAEGMLNFRDVARDVFTQVALEGAKLGDVLRAKLSDFASQKAGSLFTSAFNGLWSGLGLPAFANGTSNFEGGLARVNERGGEIMNLPSGTEIIPHDVSMRMADRSGGAEQQEVAVRIVMDDSTGKLAAMIDRRAGNIAQTTVKSGAAWAVDDHQKRRG